MTPTPCDVHKVKLCPPILKGADVIRRGACMVCQRSIEVVYGFAGAFDLIDGGEVAYEEIT